MKRQRGMGMIEILMAVLITAIGLIGITGMQAVSLKNNLSALNRSNAIFLTGSIMDRVRANPTADFTTAVDDPPSVSLDLCATSADTCSKSQIADLNIAQWKCTLGGYQDSDICAGISPVMPDAQGGIDVDVNGDYVITIQWMDRISYADGANTGGQVVAISTTLRR